MSEMLFFRVEQIMADREYRLQLVRTLAETNPEVIEAAAMADSTNWMNALSDLHQGLTRCAREMAASEIRARNALERIVPNNVQKLTLRGVA